MPQPRVFIGSSKEGHYIAELLQLGLDSHAECTIWSQGVFGLSGGTLESLCDSAKSFDFALLVLTPDDLVQKRNDLRRAPRDNILFELGLFMGSLGREATFIVCCSDDQLELPSDLAGVTAVRWRKRTDGNLQAALGPACTRYDEDLNVEKLRKHPEIEKGSVSIRGMVPHRLVRDLGGVAPQWALDYYEATAPRLLEPSDILGRLSLHECSTPLWHRARLPVPRRLRRL